MFKSVKTTFLAGVLIAVMLTASFGSHLALAATVTDQDIEEQEAVVREQAEDTIRGYLRLALYLIIMRLEERIDNA